MRVSGSALWNIGVLVALASACSGNTESYTSNADTGTTHALVSVERRDVFGTSEPAQNRAFASFVRTPPDADPAVVLRVVALGSDLPEAGQCTSPSAPREGAAPLAPSARVELLDAGDVTLETSAGRVELAPRAFPAVTSLFSGVVYSSRERTSPLPPAEAYAVSASGGALGAPLALSVEAPRVLSDVRLDGIPLDQEASLNPAGTELGWARGNARDLVYVTVTAADGSHRVTCSFRDEGRGFLPAASVPEGSPAGLALHRLRVIPMGHHASKGVDAGELRFDFELSTTVAVRAR